MSVIPYMVKEVAEVIHANTSYVYKLISFAMKPSGYKSRA